MADLGKDNLNSGSSAGKLRSNFLAQPKFLKAPVLNNPFTKFATDNNPNNVISDNPFAPISGTSKESLAESKLDTNNTNDTKKTKESDAVPKFVPLHTSKESISFAGGTVTTATPTGLSRAAGFVFGQNLKARIVGGPENVGEGTSGSSAEHSATNGASDFLFAAAVQATADNQSTSKDDGNSLFKSAHTWERVRDTSGPVIPPPQQVLTGEEGEKNQLQMNCRLFAFEGGLWKERGRAQLRLNDSQTGSRLVCRSSGSFRVLLNTKIWAGMTVERPGAKSLRVTATDSQQQLKVFLIMATPDEIKLLFKSLTRRVEQATLTDNACENPSKDTSDPTEKNNASLPDEEKSPSIPNECKLVDHEEESDSAEDHNIANSPNSSKNPLVVISAEEDDNSKNREIRKRSLSGERTYSPKKMCMEFPSEDDAQL